MSTTGDAEDRFWKIYAKYIEVLEKAGFKELHETDPHISIKHIYNRIQPPQLKRRIKNIAQVKKWEKFDEKDFNVYMLELAKQSKKLGEEQKMDVVESSESESEEDKNVKRKKKKSKKSKKRKKPEDEDTEEPTPGATNPKKPKKLPDCLNHKRSEKHWRNDCPFTSKQERKKLISYYKANKKNERES